MKTIRIILFVVIFSTTALAKLPVPESNESKATEPEISSTVAGTHKEKSLAELPVMIVNGRKLSQKDFTRFFNSAFRNGMKKYKKENPEADMEQAKTWIKEKALNQITTRTLFDEELDKESIEITDEDLKNYLCRRWDIDVNDPNNYIDEFMESLSDRKEWLRQRLREDKFKGKPKITDTQIEKYYPKHINCCWSVPEKIKISLIRIAFDKENQQEAKAKAEALLKQINAGADFAELASKNLEDYSA